MNKTIKVIKEFMALGLFILIFCVTIAGRQSAARGICSALTFSVSSLIPSVMPFMFLSTMYSGLPCSSLLCRILSPITRHIFRLPAICGNTVFFGLTCGYPVSAKLSSLLLQSGQLSEKDAKRAACCLLNPGIPFCVLFMGGVILDDITLGWIIYGSITVADIFLLFLSGLKSSVPPKTPLTFECSDFTASLKNAVDSTVKACLTMSIYIILFRGFIQMLLDLGIFAFINSHLHIPHITVTDQTSLLAFMFEVTFGINVGSDLNADPAIFAFGAALGGICVLLQTLSFFPKNSVSFGKMLLFRSAAGGISVLLVKLSMIFYSPSSEIFSTIERVFPVGTKGNLTASLCMMLLFTVYALTGEKIQVDKKRKI